MPTLKPGKKEKEERKKRRDGKVMRMRNFKNSVTGFVPALFPHFLKYSFLFSSLTQMHRENMKRWVGETGRAAAIKQRSLRGKNNAILYAELRRQKKEGKRRRH